MCITDRMLNPSEREAWFRKKHGQGHKRKPIIKAIIEYYSIIISLIGNK